MASNNPLIGCLNDSKASNSASAINPYATTSATIGTATTEVHSSSLSAIVRVLPNAPVTIAVINNGVALTPTVTNFKAVKIV